MTAPVQKTFEPTAHVVPAGGEDFFITPSLSTTRYVEYLKKVPRLTFRVTYEGMYDTLSKIYTATASGNDMIFAIQTAKELAWNQLDAIRRFDENEIPEIIDFCALFLNRPGEDLSKFDAAIHEQKKQILSQEGYDVGCFFGLAFGLIENLSASYHKIRSVANPKGANDITLSDPIPQTSHTS